MMMYLLINLYFFVMGGMSFVFVMRVFYLRLFMVELNVLLSMKYLFFFVLIRFDENFKLFFVLEVLFLLLFLLFLEDLLNLLDVLFLDLIGFLFNLDKRFLIFRSDVYFLWFKALLLKMELLFLFVYFFSVFILLSRFLYFEVVEELSFKEELFF